MFFAKRDHGLKPVATREQSLCDEAHDQGEAHDFICLNAIARQGTEKRKQRNEELEARNN